MNFLPARRVGAALTIFCLFIVAGCAPPSGSATTSPAERYLKSGQARAQQNDFAGALADYEKALAINMNDPSVHYQLALLFGTELNQPEKALYHFTRVLELNPDFRWSDMIKDRLPGLRMRVSSGSIPMVPCAELEKQIVQLHRDLATKNDDLQRQSNQIEELRRRYLALTTTPSQTPIQTAPQTFTRSQATGPQRPIPNQPSPTTIERTVIVPVQQPTGDDEKLIYNPPRQINYKVLRGDTLYSLGRRYEVDIKEILRLNPGLTAASLKIGETIVIPGR